MLTISIEVAQAQAAELIRKMSPGDELIITVDDQPIARLTTTNEEHNSVPRQPGTLRGTVTYMAPDFDAPLDEFQEYMS